MPSRRKFLIMVGGIGALIAVSAPALAQTDAGSPKAVTAITKVFGDGIRLIAVAIEYSQPIMAQNLPPTQFHVDGRTVTGVFISTSVNPADQAASGRFVIVALSEDDENAGLAEKLQPQGGKGGPPNGGHGPGSAGDIPTYDTIYRTPEAKISQVLSLEAADGTAIPRSTSPFVTTHVENLIVDDFRQLEFQNPGTGRSLKYNLFIPKEYEAAKSYPLVLFMHDAGATSDVTRTTLLQGLGAICWASPEDQAKRPCFVLAPQYEEIIADDESRTSGMLDTTVDLVKALTEQYNIDKSRLYATGQSGGCMMSIAMNIKYPDLFAASFLVAGQWDPTLVKPLAHEKLWILVSQDDDKAFPGQNGITEVLEAEGAKISRAVWDGTWTQDQFRFAFDAVDAERTTINYVTFRQGTVIPKGESTAGASGHRNTWRIAYTIEPIREWIFRQNG